MNIEAETDADVPFTRCIRNRVRAVDVAVILAVPLVLGLVYQAPTALRRSLVFEYGDPSLVTSFTSAFVHLDAGHLFVNLVSYALVVPLVYLLSVASGQRYRFYSAFLTFVFVFPVALSYLNLAVPRAAVAYGFSGVVMAFVGYLPLALAEFVDRHFDVGPTTATAPMLFFLGTAAVAALSVRSVVPENTTVLLGNAGLVAAALLAALLYALSAYDRGANVRSNLRGAVDAAGYVELAVVGLLVFLAFPFVAFPGNVVRRGTELNLYVHLLGYALGFMVTYVTVATTVRVQTAESDSPPA